MSFDLRCKNSQYSFLDFDAIFTPVCDAPKQNASDNNLCTFHLHSRDHAAVNLVQF